MYPSPVVFPVCARNPIREHIEYQKWETTEDMGISEKERNQNIIVKNNVIFRKVYLKNDN